MRPPAAQTTSMRRRSGTTWGASSTPGAGSSTAKTYARKSVQIRETVLGPDHVAVAADLAALAALVQEQQRFDEAEKLYRRAIAIFDLTWLTFGLLA